MTPRHDVATRRPHTRDRRALAGGPVGAVVGGAIGAVAGTTVGALDAKAKDDKVVVTQVDRH